MERYGVNGNAPAKTFIMTIANILRKSNDRAGLHTVHIALKQHNCKRVDDPTREIRNWFDEVERGLVIHQVNGRGCMRKNGCRIPSGSYVSHYIGDVLHIGIMCEVYTGSRPRVCPHPTTAATYTPCCALCIVRDITSERRVLHGAQLIVVQDNRQAADLQLICSTQLTELYVRAIWKGDELERLRDQEHAYALVLAHRL